MLSPSTVSVTRRARPLLGTLVSIELEGLGDAEASAAIAAAFHEIQLIHDVMSFHQADSDVSRLNRDAHRASVTVNARTIEVLDAALTLSAASGGVFDMCVAPRLVDAGTLPSLTDTAPPDFGATWRDVELNAEEGAVRFNRPLWIDLGGIAKGYAVDRALALLRASGAERACVNAGGDLAMFGPRAEPVQLRAPDAPVLVVSNAALASSEATPGVHFDALRGAGASACNFATVVAAQCMHADALTKIALAQGAASAALLSRYDATAYVHDGAWHTIGADA